MKVTVLTTRLFDAPSSGGELCTARLLAALQAGGHQVRLIGRGSAAGALPPGPVSVGPVSVGPVSVGQLVPAFDTLPPLRRAASLLGAWARGQACTVHRLAGAGTVRQAAQALLAAPMDALVVDHLQAWAWARPLRQRLPAPLLVLHNLESAGYAEQAAKARGLQQRVLQREARLLAALEADALQHAAAVACLSEDDLRRLSTDDSPLLQLPGHPPVHGRLPAPDGPRHQTGRGPTIGLLGTWTWAPNRAALQWMLAEVLPQLGPDCQLLLAGTGLDRLPVALSAARRSQLRVLGQVADVGDFYRRVDVVALPSLQGSGVQEKAIEAIARARALVATPHALRGLGPDLPGHVQQASSAADFAACCHAAVPSTPADRLAVQRWARQRAALYQQQLLRGLLASAATRPLPQSGSPMAAAPQR